MNIKNLVIASIVAIVAVSAFAASGDSLLTEVQNGVKILSCDLGNGMEVIDPSKVVDFYGDMGHWKFTNGGASACEVTVAN